MAKKKKYVQPFTRKPANEAEALEALEKAQADLEEAERIERKFWNTGKPGKQRRENAVGWAKSALQTAKDNLEEIRHPELTLPLDEI